MKTAGLCAVSDEECFEIREYWPEKHPFAGEPRRFGAPHKDALRVALVMADGSLMHITIKACELVNLETNLPATWCRIKERMRHERKAHAALNQRDFTLEQHRFMDEENLRFNDNVPLGILFAERWRDVRG